MAYGKKWFNNYNGSKWRGQYKSNYYNNNVRFYGKPSMDKLAYMAAKAIKQANYLKSTMQRELKCVDTWGNSAITTGSTQVVNVSVINEGSSKYNRVGSKVLLKSVYLTGSVAINPAQNTPQLIRIALVVDSDSRGSVPSWDDIFEATNTSGSSQVLNQIESPVNTYTYPGRFKILYDGFYNLSTSLSAVDTAQFFREGQRDNMKSGIYRKVNIPMQFTNSTTGNGAATNNAIYLVLMQTTTTNLAYWNYNVRLRFYDD